jgi:hypothetical protein
MALPIADLFDLLRAAERRKSSTRIPGLLVITAAEQFFSTEPDKIPNPFCSVNVNANPIVRPASSQSAAAAP